MIRMRSAALVGLLVCLIGAVFARGSASRAAQPLTIAIVPTEVSAQAYYALDLGYFGAHGLAVKILPMQNGAAASSAAISGSIDIVHSDTLSMVDCTQQDASVPHALWCQRQRCWNPDERNSRRPERRSDHFRKRSCRKDDWRVEFEQYQ
jgi:ABC-type nitrate/sulfonate/bicarbonate transport system substrate-binding protein